jgi:hypothetical protein
VCLEERVLTDMPPNNLGRDSLAMDKFMLFIALAMIGLWPVVADGILPRWRSAPGVIPRAGIVPGAGVVARDCAILDAASTNDRTPEASEPKSEDGGTWAASARIAPNRVRCSFQRKPDGLAVDLDEKQYHAGHPKIMKDKKRAWGGSFKWKHGWV